MLYIVLSKDDVFGFCEYLQIVVEERSEDREHYIVYKKCLYYGCDGRACDMVRCPIRGHTKKLDDPTKLTSRRSGILFSVWWQLEK